MSMKNNLIVFIALSFFLYSCNQEGQDEALEYVVDVHIDESALFFNTELRHINVLDSVSFKLNKKIKNIKVFGEGVVSMRIDSLDAYQNLVTLSLKSKKSDIVRFEYTLSIDDSFLETTGGRGVLLQGAELIPIVKSDIFIPPTYVFEVKNESKYHVFANFINGIKTTSDKVFMNVTEKPFDVYQGDVCIVRSISKDSDFVKNIAEEVSNVISYYSGLFDEEMNEFVIVINDFGNHSFFTSPNFVNLYYYNADDYNDKTASYSYLYNTLSHELAHKWFSMSNVYNVSPSAFIDEGFSDYLSVMYARQKYGEVHFEQIIKSYKEYAEGGGSIMSVHEGMDFDLRAQSLYGKGMLFCYELELYMGRDGFVDFLKLLVIEKPVNIEALMLLIEKNYDKKIYELAWSLLNN